MTTVPCPSTAPARMHATRALAALVFVQMLPATLLAPAIRPFFAALHSGNVSAMHAFMSVNMVGAALGAVIISRVARSRPGAWVAGLAVGDAALLFAMTLPLPIPVLLGLRAVEGALHVGASSLLLACAADRRHRHDDRFAVPMAGAALMLAIAAGSALGAGAVSIGPRTPFALAGALLLVAATFASRSSLQIGARAESASVTPPSLRTTPMTLAVGAAFIGRFAIGCIVVSFALFAHHVHALSDAQVGALFSLLTFPFALATYPAGRIADRFSRAVLMAAGATVLALSLGVLGSAPTMLLPVIMVLAGIGCAAVFGSTLCYAASGASAIGRARAMGYVNAAGCLGMLLGPAASGILAAVLRDPSEPGKAPRAAFALAAAAVGTWLAASVPALVRAAREELAAWSRAPKR